MPFTECMKRPLLLPWFWTVLSIILHCIFTHSSVRMHFVRFCIQNTNYLALKYAIWDVPRVFLLKIRSHSQRVWWASSLRPVLTYYWCWWVHDYVCIYIRVNICLQLGLYCVRPNSVVLSQSYINILQKLLPFRPKLQDMFLFCPNLKSNSRHLTGFKQDLILLVFNLI